ncbi:MAG TPA: hypothetical protein VFU12_17375 [Glycomyces sp.]|nr:hypothetical protein [Glycomyces sp.]
MIAGGDLVQRRIEQWRRIRERYAEAETAASRSADASVTIRLSVAGTVEVALDAHKAELTEDQAFLTSVIETYNSASRRLRRGLNGIETHTTPVEDGSRDG